MAKRKPKVAGSSEGSRGDRVIEFAETHCRVPEGRDVGKPIVLRPWQREIVHRIYDNPLAETRQAIISVGRKNAKTALAGILTLAHLVGPEAEANSQLYSTALSREQAAVLFGLASKMVRLDEQLAANVVVTDSGKRLFCTLTGCLYQALSADASTAMGRSPAFAVHDELGQTRGPRSPLYEAVESGMGAHARPLSVVISTQAPTDADLLSVLIDDARASADPSIVLTLFEAPKDADPWAESTWRAANPALGDFLSIEEMRRAAAKAQRMPALENGFRNLHLNQRVAAVDHFLSPDVWKLSGGEPDLGLFDDLPVYGGLDLSAKNDLTALVLICREPGGPVQVWPHFFAPQDGVRDREDRDKAPYPLWARQGLLTLTPGPTVDYAWVAHRIGEMARKMTIKELAFDRWRIDDLKRELGNLGIETREPDDDPRLPGIRLRQHGQGYRDMSPAIEELEDLALRGMLRHGMHPILTWNASNVVVTTDPAGGRKFDKAKATGRIDGMQALAMAVRSAAVNVAAAPVRRKVTLEWF